MKKHYFRYLLCRRFDSVTEASQKLNVANQRLSRYLSGAIDLNSTELERLRTGLKLKPTTFKKVIDPMYKQPED